MHTTTNTLTTLQNCRTKYVAPATVATFLQSFTNDLRNLRGDALKRAKQERPACLPHAITKGGRRGIHVQQFARRVQVDLDAADNAHVFRTHGVRGVGFYLSRQPWAELVAVSASGRGLFVWVHTADPYTRELAEGVLRRVVDIATADGVPLVPDTVNSLSPVALRFAGAEVLGYNADAVPI